MESTLESAIMAFILAVLCIGAIFFNVLVVIAILHSKMMQSHSPVYIFAFATIANDMMMIFLHLFYFVPSCFLQDYLFYGSLLENGRKALDVLLLFSWYHGTLSHIVIAINRFVTVIFYQYPIFTRSRVLVIAVIQILASVGLAIMTQLLFPCCRLSFTYAVYTYTYIEKAGVPNYTNMFDLPLNSVASLTPLLAYGTIAIVIFRANEKIGRGQIREYIFAIQFAIMALIYTLVWMSVRVMPMILSGTDKLYLYGLTTCFTICNTSTNAVVYLTNNKEIRKSLRSFNNLIQTTSTVVHSSKRSVMIIEKNVSREANR